MQTMKLTFVTAGVVLVGSLLLNGCDGGNVNTQTGTPDLTVTTEDGTGDDIKIATAVNTALIADQQLQNLDIQIETRKGDVTISGNVNSEAQKDQAERVTTAISGVHAVNNKLEVK
ncbi:BON domain-containing protein [Shewanella baltica]|uniref:Transport-associated n=1 Tax=Shewanella baltica (strain OS195) TaxID=399599 RepID=A9L380_SHEB9|nr:BON domain-containing protein [Shewanella baltica]ABX51009.1 transport-associated [Shewanella baltica OS195]ADT96009.1 transport-associated protein [Shewanella baltica OS678]EHC08065.1 transport-associated protein [Shewanella baltica OS625]MCS6118176.1 BON domain-containing protein [Shewanella baltica]